MRYLFPLVLVCTLAGYAQAEDTRSQLPANAATVQIMGNTYYKSGDTYYRFNEQGGYFYETQPPSLLPDSSEAHMYQRSQTVPAPSLSGDQIQGCRDQAADKSNAVPNRGSDVYISEYNRCVTDLQQQ